MNNMKRFILIFFMVLISVRLMSQSVDVSFSGSTVYGRYIALDSVVVHNITRGWTATLVAPDTVCSLSVSSVDMLSAGNNGLQPNVPNPFHGKTEVEILLPAPDDVVIKVFDVGGRLYADYSGYLPEGNHRFEISLGTPQSYLLVLSTSEGMSSIKMLNLGSGGANSITYNGFVGNMSKLSVDMDFQRGDNLECTAYTTYADSVYEKRLVISPIEETHQVFRFNLKSGSADLQTACEEYTWIDGNTYTESNNTATYTVVNSIGCDSVITLNLEIYHADTTEIYVLSCESYIWDGQTYDENGTYERTFTSIHGCDSIVIMHLDLGHPVDNEIDVVYLYCEPYIWEGQAYEESGTYERTFATEYGCDSIVVMHLEMEGHPVSSEFDVSSCEPYRWNQTTYYQTGIYRQLFQTAMGCDSLVTMNLTINSPVEHEFAETACDSYEWNGQTYSESGSYVQTLEASTGCDSVVTLNLTIYPTYLDTVTVSGCDSVTIEGITFTDTGFHEFNYQSVNGCDSTVVVSIVIWQPETSEKDTLVCESYEWEGLTYTENSTHIVHYETIHGCDSTVAINFIVMHPPTETVDIRTACDSLVWVDGNTYYEDNDGATYTYRLASGCDSVVRLSLTVLHSVEYEFYASDCGPYSWNGRTYYSSGNFTATYTAENGCDSIVTLHFSRLNDYVFDTIYACDSYTWQNGVTYTLDNIPNNGQQFISASVLYTNSHGCDSTVFMRLFLQANDMVDTHRACESFTWIDGNTYTESNNTATVTYTNQYGCDSVIRLNLTVGHNDGVVHEVEIEECAYYRMPDGEYLIESGDYQRTITSSCGCDSIVLIHLTITGENGLEGSLYDGRDNRTYRTMQYGCQTWMAEDLRTSYLADGTSPTNSYSLLYFNGYYDPSYAGNANGFCPQGWHLPTRDEWNELVNYLKLHGEYVCGESESVVKSMVSDTGWTTSSVECSPGNNQSENNLSGLGIKSDGKQWLGPIEKDGYHDRVNFVYLRGTNSYYATNNYRYNVLSITNDATNISFEHLDYPYGARIRCVRND